MIETAYLIGVPIALIIITVVNAHEFGVITVGGFAENILLAIFWPPFVFCLIIAAIITCDFRMWER